MQCVELPAKTSLSAYFEATPGQWWARRHGVLAPRRDRHDEREKERDESKEASKTPAASPRCTDHDACRTAHDFKGRPIN